RASEVMNAGEELPTRRMVGGGERQRPRSGSRLVRTEIPVLDAHPAVVRPRSQKSREKLLRVPSGGERDPDLSRRWMALAGEHGPDTRTPEQLEQGHQGLVYFGALSACFQENLLVKLTQNGPVRLEMIDPTA